jgi:hypothetical protein
VLAEDLGSLTLEARHPCRICNSRSFLKKNCSQEDRGSLLYRTLRKEIRRYWRSHNRWPGELGDHIVADPASEHNVRAVKLVERVTALCKLAPDERDLLERHVFLGHTLSQVADES